MTQTPFQEYIENHPPYIEDKETLVIHNDDIETSDRPYYLLIKTDDGRRIVPRPLVIDIIDIFASQDWPDKLEMTFKRSEKTGWLYIHKWQKVVTSV